ncbi:MAG: glycosyltransferase family 4 protein [Pseudomonadota bacterium]
MTTWWLVRSRFFRIALDHPNRRSLHQTPVPRTGGLAVCAGILIGAAVVAPNLPMVIWIGCAVVLTISFADDVRGVPVLLRLGVHLLAAGTCAASVLTPDYGMLTIAVAALAIAWMMNLFNFMDGSDGLAGGMVLIGFSVYGVAAWAAGSTAFALTNFSVAAAAAAFLVFNFHPARIFLGDVGAVPLGFLAAALGLLGWLQRDWTWWFPLLVFSPFVVDASVTLARRLLRRERVWEAHRDHYYQRLVQLGWGHRRTALAEYVLMLACGAAALTALSLPAAGRIAVLATAVVIYLALIASVENAWKTQPPRE